MAKRREYNESDDHTQPEVHLRPRTSRRAAHEAQRVIDEVAAGDLSESMPERAPRVHWRKRLAAVQKLSRKQTRKPDKSKTTRGAPSVRPPPPQLSQLPQQPQLPAPVQLPPPLVSIVVNNSAPLKLREHHHEFLSEYYQHQLEVAAAGDFGTRAEISGGPPVGTVQPVELMRKLNISQESRGNFETKPAFGEHGDDDFGANTDTIMEATSVSAAAMQLPLAMRPSFPSVHNLQPSDSPQSSGVASSRTDVSFPGVKIENCPSPADDGGAVSDNESDASTAPSQSTARTTLDRSGGSSIWWLPSNAALLSFASCMAA